MSEALPFDPTITIRAETSQADPDTCTFMVSRMVHPGGPFFFDSGSSPFRAFPTSLWPRPW